MSIVRRVASVVLWLSFDTGVFAVSVFMGSFLQCTKRAIKIMIGMGIPRKSSSSERIQGSFENELKRFNSARSGPPLVAAEGGRPAGNKRANQQGDEKPQG